MAFLLRVRLPDRPGALGAVATALGTVDADILSVDVIERGEAHATDDFVVELPAGRLADTLVSAAATVPDVVVESIRPFIEQPDPHRELALLDQLGRDGATLDTLAAGVTDIVRASWALVLAEPVSGQSAVIASGGAAPEIESLPVPWWPPRPSRPLDPDTSWAPPDWGRLDTELCVTELGTAALLVGRPALRWVPSELVRLHYFATIAAGVVPLPG